MINIFDDPVPALLPGDAALAGRFGVRYNQTADSLRDAAKGLLALANESITISLAVEEVRTKANEVYSDTLKVATRYDVAGDALNSYSNALGNAQAAAASARSTIITNNANAHYWRQHKRELELEIGFGGASATQAADLVTATRHVNDYAGIYHTAINNYHTAEEDRRQAIVNAIHGLDDAEQSAGLQDNFFEAIGGAAQQLYELAQKYLAPLIEQLRGILEIIKSIVDILSLIVTILALFIPALAPLAALLALVSIGLSLAIFLCSAALVFLGKETMGRLLSDAINVVASVVTAKLGGAFKPGALTGLAAIGTKAAWASGVEGTKLAFQLVGTQEGLLIAGNLVADEFMEAAAVIIPDTILENLAENGIPGTSDQYPNPNGPAWGTDASPVFAAPGGANVETVYDFGAEPLVNAVTGGVFGAVTDMFSAGSEIAHGLNDTTSNIVSFGAVPAL